jgi:hypothetical protein
MMAGESFGACDKCGARYLMNGDAVYGWCHDPDCDGEVRDVRVAKMIDNPYLSPDLRAMLEDGRG